MLDQLRSWMTHRLRYVHNGLDALHELTYDVYLGLDLLLYMVTFRCYLPRFPSSIYILTIVN